MRHTFFAATALWGFILGAGFLAVAMSVSNIPIPKHGSSFGLLGTGAVLAVVGGLLAAKSYKESRHR